MNTKIGISFLALLIMAGMAMPTMAGKDKLDPDPTVGGYIQCTDCIGINLWVYNMDYETGQKDGWWEGNTPMGGWNFWKKTNTECESPQCDEVEGNNNLVDDLSVDFTKYPAQQDCKDIDGRLPTKEELAIIYENRANLGNNFAHMYYWSSTEYNDEMAYYQAFRSGRQSWAKKDTARYIRCVRTNAPGIDT